MIKLLILGRRAAGLTRARAMRHLRLVHGPMVYDPPANSGPGPAHYVQNHVFDGVHLGAGHDGLTPYGIDRDLVTEVWFESVGDMIASTQTPYYLANLKPDEPRFVDDATVVRCMAVEGPRQGADDVGHAKLFVFLKAEAGTDREAAASAWRSTMEPALAGAGAAWLENTVNGRPGEEPFTHAVWEAWFHDRDTLERFVNAPLPAVLHDLESVFDPHASLYLLAEEYTVERLRSGV